MGTKPAPAGSLRPADHPSPEIAVSATIRIIEVPVPGLVVMIGAAGSGKSTLAAQLFEASEVLSSDALRAAVSGDAADQAATRPAFGILHREARRRLAEGRLVVVDATNVERFARATLVRIARAAATPVTAIAVLPDAFEVHRRNRGRAGRIVPAAVVDRHLLAIAHLGSDAATATAALLAEGFSAVHLVPGEDDRVALRLERVEAARSQS
jgi:protein phosphatase